MITQVRWVTGSENTIEWQSAPYQIIMQTAKREQLKLRNNVENLQID